jgi:hypothetical protein
MKTIKLPVFDIVVTLGDNNSGKILSSMGDKCPFCGLPQCGMDCGSAEEWISDRDIDIQKLKEGRVRNFQLQKAAFNSIESFILACACAGIDIETSAFLEAIETSFDAVGFNIENMEVEDIDINKE